MLDNQIARLPNRDERPDRPAPQPGETATTALVTIAAFLSWLPADLRPVAVAKRCAHLLVWQGRPAAVLEWNVAKARFYDVLRVRKIVGPGVIKAYAAWREEVGRLGRAAKEHEVAEREDLSCFGDPEPGREQFLETRHAWGS